MLSHFLSFDPLNNPKNQNLEKIKKKNPRDIIILHLCTTNDNHMMHGSSDIKCNRQNFLSFWAIFLPFYPPSSPKNQNVKKKKKMKKTPGDIITLNMCAKIYD